MLNFPKHLETLKHEPQWFKDERGVAWETFSKAPLPSPSDESWRQLDLKAINLEILEVLPYTQKHTHSLKNIDQLFEHGDEQCIYWGKQIKRHIADPAGIIVESPAGLLFHLNEDIARQGVICTTISEALVKHGDLVKSFLAKSADDTEPDKLALLNQAMCHGGMFIYVPDGVVLIKPLVCLNLFDLRTNTLSMSRFVLLAGRNSQLSAISILAGSKQRNKDNKYALVDYLLQAHLQAGAQLDYVEVQSFDDSTFVINNANYCLEKDSRSAALIAALGAGQNKGEIRTVLKERGAECKLSGIVLGNKSECFNFNTIDDHDAPDTKSTIDFRVALKDEAKSIYHGTIKVAKNANKTNAFQSNKNLLLGEKAHADSIPKLEILTDDVKCSHGATVGPVDRNQLFYLMSRGLSAGKAEELIVNGFFHQLIGDCNIQGVADWLDALVSNKIEFGTLDAEGHLPEKKEPVAAALSISHKKAQPVGARLA